jgi:hypothetical protein
MMKNLLKYCSKNCTMCGRKEQETLYRRIQNAQAERPGRQGFLKMCYTGIGVSGKQPSDSRKGKALVPEGKSNSSGEKENCFGKMSSYR